MDKGSGISGVADGSDRRPMLAYPLSSALPSSLTAASVCMGGICAAGDIGHPMIVAAAVTTMYPSDAMKPSKAMPLPMPLTGYRTLPLPMQ